MSSFGSVPPARSGGGGGSSNSGGAVGGGNSGGSFDGFSNANIRGLSGPDQVNLFHESADTDRDQGAAHHTLGVGPSQAASGDHTHEGGAKSKKLPASSVLSGYPYSSLSARPARISTALGTTAAVGTSTTPVAVVLTSPQIAIVALSDIEVIATWDSWTSTVALDRARFTLRYSINNGSTYLAFVNPASVLQKVDSAGNAQQGGSIMGVLVNPGAGNYKFGLFCERAAGTGSITVNNPCTILGKELS